MKSALGPICVRPMQGGGVQICSVVDETDHTRGLSHTQALALSRAILDATIEAVRADQRRGPPEPPDMRPCVECPHPALCVDVGCQVRRGPEDKG